MRHLLLLKKNTPRRSPTGAVVGLFFLALLVLASPASAAYQQLPPPNGIFGGSAELVKEEKFGEEVQLGGTGALAVNRSGAGGVPAGTVYAVLKASSGSDRPRVAMFEPKAGGGLEFIEGWQVARPGPYERCGPLLGTKVVEGKEVLKQPCPVQRTVSAGRLGIDVDQSTGYVYVYASFPEGEAHETFPNQDQIVSFKADGSEVIDRFGEQATAGKTLAESPEQVHDIFGPDTLAVNSAGEVFLEDEERNVYHRLMVFRPHNGDYEDYEYAGEVAAGTNSERLPYAPVFDDAGNLYVAEILAGTTPIEALPHETPGAYPHLQQPPLCRYLYPKGGVREMTVDPKTGDLFFFSPKAPVRVRRIGPCNHATGKFAEEASPEVIPLSPEPEERLALAFDPDRQVEASRPPGLLYGAAPEATLGNYFEKSALGYIFAHPQEAPPKVINEAFAHVGTTGALVEASIDPEGFPTRYVFRYETEEQYEANDPSDRFAGASEAPVGGAVLGEGSDPLSATASLSGLLPDTAYRFRAVATSNCSSGEPSKVCEATGEALSFRTHPFELPGLPDHRAYELVSPVNKSGGQVFPAEPGVSTCTVPGRECVVNKPGATISTQIAMQSSPDGDSIVYQGSPFFTDEGYVKTDQYIARRDPKAGWQSTNLTPTQPAAIDSRAFATSLGQAVLGPVSGLSPEAPAGYRDLYLQSSADPANLTPLLGEAQSFHRTSEDFEIRYAGASEDLSRIFFEANDALTEAMPFAPEAVDGGKTKLNLYEWNEGQVSLVNVLPDGTTQPGASFGTASAHGISKDGTRVFFADESGQVYLREDGETTREIKTEGTPDPGKFLAASTDGSEVLLANGHLHSLGDEEPTVDLTQGKGGFQGVVGESEDLSHLYFIDTKVLDETPNAQSEKAEDTKFNLYSWARAEGTRFVARLLTEDNGHNTYGSAYLGADWAPLPAERTAEASPNGRWLAFLSQGRLTGYDNTGPVCRHVSAGVDAPGPCQEAFLYDATTGKLLCASCNPSGERPLGLSVLRLIHGGASSTLPQPRYLSDEGRLLFDSRDSIVLADTNHGVEDVYEFEPSGVGSCEREAGCVRLISAGTGVNDSNFLAMDESGKNVFFTTRDQLALKDTDQLIDLYDAREGGGIASETETARGECQGEACQAPVSPPNDLTPGSSTFQGAGNVKEAKAKKHKKKHAKKKKHAHKRAAKNNRGGAK